jgi:hypothetical protein
MLDMQLGLANYFTTPYFLVTTFIAIILSVYAAMKME